MDGIAPAMVSTDTVPLSNKCKYDSELQRLLTFDKWPNTYGVSPIDLAKNGFIYIGPRDRVLCVFCRRAIWTWQKGVDVYTVHLNYCPDCCFVKGECLEENIPFPQSRSSIDEMKNNPQRPAFVNKVTRLESFKFWPSKVGLKVTPESLAEAGFFYRPKTGKNDRVKCFMCGKVLHKWLPEDDPWLEHARISPDCPFVLRHKAEEELVKKRQRMQDEAILNQPCFPDNARHPSGIASDSENIRNHIAVRAVIQDFGTDFTFEEIRKAFEQLSFLNDPETAITAMNLAEKVYENKLTYC